MFHAAIKNSDVFMAHGAIKSLVENMILLKQKSLRSKTLTITE